MEALSNSFSHFHAGKHQKEAETDSSIMIILGSSIPGNGVWCLLPALEGKKDRMLEKMLMHGQRIQRTKHQSTSVISKNSSTVFQEEEVVNPRVAVLSGSKPFCTMN